MIITERNQELLTKYIIPTTRYLYLDGFICELSRYFLLTNDKEETIRFLSDFIEAVQQNAKNKRFNVMYNLYFFNERTYLEDNKIKVDNYTTTYKFLWNVVFLTLDKLDKLENENI